MPTPKPPDPYAPQSIVNTALNLALPESIWSTASCAFANGNFSIITLTPWRCAKSMHSSQSSACPDGQPWMETPLVIIVAVLKATSPTAADVVRPARAEVTSQDLRARTKTFPRASQAPASGPMTFGLGAVITTSAAPPIF